MDPKKDNNEDALRIKRINCWGLEESLDRDSVVEAIDTEDKMNQELDEYFRNVKKNVIAAQNKLSLSFSKEPESGEEEKSKKTTKPPARKRNR